MSENIAVIISNFLSANYASAFENSEVLKIEMYNDNLILCKESVCQKVYGLDERLEFDSIYNLKGEYVCSLDDLENNLTFIKDLVDVTHKTGFNEKEQKWYGWSHRAFYGFGIGSSIKKGDCAYQPDNLLNFIQATCDFWDIDGKQRTYNEYTLTETLKLIEVVGTKLNIHYTKEKFDKNNNLIEKTDNLHEEELPESFGKGEWTALSLDGAKQMAIDYAKGLR